VGLVVGLSLCGAEQAKSQLLCIQVRGFRLDSRSRTTTVCLCLLVIPALSPGIPDVSLGPAPNIAGWSKEPIKNKDDTWEISIAIKNGGLIGLDR
jgi:hypothetical protein